MNTIVPGVALALFIPCLALAGTTYEPYTISTIAGDVAQAGSVDGTGSNARFKTPIYVAKDSTGNLFVSDIDDHTIRKMTLVGSNWVVTTVAGTAGTPGSDDGLGSAALLNGPCGLTVDGSGNLYVAELENNTIRKITPAGTAWQVTTIAGTAGIRGSADGLGSAAEFNWPCGLSMDGAGSLYVAEYMNATIRKLTPAGSDWNVATIAGQALSYGFADGPGGAARFIGPADVAIDAAGNLYVADCDACTIRKVAPAGTNWAVTTLVGKANVSGSADGTNSTARFNCPVGISVDGAGNLYVVDGANNTIRKVTPVGTNWVVTTLLGNPGSPGGVDGTGSAARLWSAKNPGGIKGGLLVDSDGSLYVPGSYTHTIRKACRPFAFASAGAGLGTSDGEFTCSLTGPAGQVVVLEASIDLVNWVPIWTNTFMVGPLQFGDPHCGGSSQRFYRARRP